MIDVKIIGKMKQPENKEECRAIWCEECIYDKKDGETVLECEGIKRGWLLNGD